MSEYHRVGKVVFGPPADSLEISGDIDSLVNITDDITDVKLVHEGETLYTGDSMTEIAAQVAADKARIRELEEALREIVRCDGSVHRGAAWYRDGERLGTYRPSDIARRALKEDRTNG